MKYEYWVCCISLNTKPRQHGHHFADNTFKHIFLKENVRILLKISLNFVAKVPINIPALVQITAWGRPGDKPLPEVNQCWLLHWRYYTWSQWVNTMRLRQNFICRWQFQMHFHHRHFLFWSKLHWYTDTQVLWCVPSPTRTASYTWVLNLLFHYKFYTINTGKPSQDEPWCWTLLVSNTISIMKASLEPW